MSSAAAGWQHSPILWIALTVAAFDASRTLQRRLGHHALANPVLLSVCALVALLLLTGTPAPAYADGTAWLQWWLGPATVALAVPIYRQLPLLRREAGAVLTALVVGSATGMGTTLGLAAVCHASPVLLRTLLPKSVTSPVALAVAERVGGLPSLTIGAVIVTGVVGAVAGPTLLRILKVRHAAAQGLGLGVGAHGIATTEALRIGAVAGAFAGVGTGLNAVLTAFVAPLVAAWLQ